MLSYSQYNEKSVEGIVVRELVKDLPDNLKCDGEWTINIKSSPTNTDKQEFKNISETSFKRIVEETKRIDKMVKRMKYKVIYIEPINSIEGDSTEMYVYGCKVKFMRKLNK